LFQVVLPSDCPRSIYPRLLLYPGYQRRSERAAMWKLTVFIFITSTISWQQCSALEVSPNSACASWCLDNPLQGNASDYAASTTYNRDLSCNDTSYASTAIGQKFKRCIECESTSPRVDNATGETDTYWFLCKQSAFLITDPCFSKKLLMVLAIKSTSNTPSTIVSSDMMATQQSSRELVPTPAVQYQQH